MQVASDFIYGAIIAGVVLLMVFTLKLRGNETSIDATVFRAARIGSLSIIEAIERDFTNIGSHNPDLDVPVPIDSIFVNWDTLGVPAFLVFQARTDSLVTSQKTNVCYSWIEMPGKTVTLKSGPKPLLELKRKVGVDNNCNGGVLAGMNTNMITRFEIHFLRADGLAITELYGADADVQQIVVRMRAVSPLGPGDVIEETWWEKVFRPVNLWKRRAG